MKTTQRYTQQMVSRVCDFGVRHAQLFPKHAAADELLAALHEDLTVLTEHARGQVFGHGSVRTLYASRASAHDTLELTLERMQQTARALKLGKFDLPPTHSSRRDEVLLDIGEVFAANAEPFKQEFVRHGFPETFIDDLKKSTENLRNAKLELAASIAVRKATRAAFEDTLKKTYDDLARFDALVANTLSENTAIMAEWNHIRRVGRPPSRRKAAAAVANSSPQEQPVATGT